MDPFLPYSFMDQTRIRHLNLLQEAAKYRLLQQIKKQPGHISLLRWIRIVAGNCLIAAGAWLKERAQLDPSSAALQEVSGHFSR